MTNFDSNNNNNNQEALAATRNVQSQTLQAVQRMQVQAAESQAIGHATIEQLQEQDGRMNRTLNATSKLKDSLNKASKLQDRFGMLSLQFGTKKQAKKLVKQENKFNGKEEKEEVQPKTFKRRGPRPKKNAPGKMEAESIAASSFNTNSSMDSIVQASVRESHDMTHQVDRAELFAGAKSKPQKMKKHQRDYGHNNSNNKSQQQQQPLTDQERHELSAIAADDQAVDAGLDVLGTQVESLLTLSQTMGDTASQQTKKLSSIHADMDKAHAQQQRVNQRAKLFTLNRKQKQKEKNKFQTPLSTQTMAAKTAMGL